jgi:hypothetical protein
MSPSRPTRVGRLTEELQHYAYRDIGHHLEMMNRVTTSRRRMHAAGRRAGYTQLALQSARGIPAQLRPPPRLPPARPAVISAMNASMCS